MTTALAVMAGGLGALARFEAGGLVERHTRSPFPWGTTVVNLAGAVAFGLVVGLESAGTLSGAWVRVGGTGFLGGFTTFSTWMVESVHLGRRGSRGSRGARALLAANVLAVPAVGVAGATLGWWLGGG